MSSTENRTGIWLAIFAGIIGLIVFMVLLPTAGVSGGSGGAAVLCINAPVDTYVFTYDSATGNCEWEVNAAGVDVTLAGTPDYITISDQIITRNLVDMAADVTGVLPLANGGTASATGDPSFNSVDVIGISDSSYTFAGSGGNNCRWGLQDDNTFDWTCGTYKFRVADKLPLTITYTDIIIPSAVDFTVTTVATFDNANNEFDMLGNDIVNLGGLTDHGVLVSGGTGAVASTAVGTADQVLTSNGAGNDPTFQTLPAAGGITEGDLWRLHTSFTGDANPIASNWERMDNAGFGLLGTGMTESSGVFTFPSTGIWYVTFGVMLGNVAADNELDTMIRVTEDDSSFETASNTQVSIYTSSARTSSYTSTIFDVTSTSTHKIEFSILGNGGNNTIFGSTTNNYTFMTFVRLGDT